MISNPVQGAGVIDLAEVRAARSRADVSRGVPYAVTAVELFRNLETQAEMIGEVAGRMAAELASFSDDLGDALEEALVVRQFCADCQDALLLEDIDAMEQARDRLAAEFASLEIGMSRPAGN
ncbi:hypothetical protein JL100_017060 [Skermanella mucosa]|uniref:hypothetical protein n=1 Tax=Skermanella mucosa TaxID=1789672 RepID=UPI00192C8D99|nr:hypothetical protein [Skermanella mucosa]UEM18807.1 hypothetical protein JL100_017060 [Skermanella mucosa]